MTTERNKKSFAAAASNPSAVEYRLKRLRDRIADVGMFLRSIDPACFPEKHAAATEALGALSAAVTGFEVPPKKARKSEADKLAAAAAREAEKVARIAAREAAKAQRLAAAASSSAAAASAAPPASSQGTSAIERALAAAKARKAAKAAAGI
jgi:hypothetical protein